MRMGTWGVHEVEMRIEMKMQMAARGQCKKVYDRELTH